MDKQKNLHIYFSRAMIILSLIVVLLGAYTRLKDAGLGCPDWPGCYGKILAPITQNNIESIQMNYPLEKIESYKAWLEMIHRYVAGTLGLMVFAYLGMNIVNKPKNSIVMKSSIILSILIIFQALLGMWTVTLRLYPVVVMLHLLGGFTTLCLLWYQHLHLTQNNKNISFNNSQENSKNSDTLKKYLSVSIVLLGLQIMLGGWTSANYAALVCTDFPTCQGVLFPKLDLSAFNFFKVGIFDSPGEPLQNTARVTIHFAHRVGALIVAIFLSLSCYKLINNKERKDFKIFGIIIFSLLTIQIALGISNIIGGLPIHVSLMHNAVAVLLMIVLITLRKIMHDKKTSNF